MSKLGLIKSCLLFSSVELLQLFFCLCLLGIRIVSKGRSLNTLPKPECKHFLLNWILNLRVFSLFQTPSSISWPWHLKWCSRSFCLNLVVIHFCVQVDLKGFAQVLEWSGSLLEYLHLRCLLISGFSLLSARTAYSARTALSKFSSCFGWVLWAPCVWWVSLARYITYDFLRLIIDKENEYLTEILWCLICINECLCK